MQQQTGSGASRLSWSSGSRVPMASHLIEPRRIFSRPRSAPTGAMALYSYRPRGSILRQLQSAEALKPHLLTTLLAPVGNFGSSDHLSMKMHDRHIVGRAALRESVVGTSASDFGETGMILPTTLVNQSSSTDNVSMKMGHGHNLHSQNVVTPCL